MKKCSVDRYFNKTDGMYNPYSLIAVYGLAIILWIGEELNNQFQIDIGV